MLLRYPGVDKDEEEYADNEESKTEEVENLSESTEEVKEVTDFVLGQGIPPVKDFPFLNRFKIPIENDDNVRDGPVNDMLKFCSDQSQSGQQPEPFNVNNTKGEVTVNTTQFECDSGPRN